MLRGVLSPILFTFYIDDLLTDMSSLGVGCYWDLVFAVSVCHVADMAL